MTAPAAALDRPGRPVHRRASVVITVAVLGLATAAAGLAIAVRAADQGEGHAPWPVIQGVCFATVASPLGAFLIVKGAPFLIGGIVLVAGVTCGLSVLLSTYGSALLAEGSAGALVPLLAAQVLWPFYVVLPVTALPLLFPAGLLPGRIWRVLGVLTAATVAGLFVGSFTAFRVGSDEVRTELANPFGWSVQPVLVVGFESAAVVCAVGGLAALLVRIVRGSPLVRRQVALLLIALTATVASILAGPVLPDAVLQVAMTVCPILVLLAIATAVLAYDLDDLELVISRVAVYLGLTAAMSAVFGAVYVTVVAAASDLASSMDRWVAASVAAVVVVVCIEPLRRRMRDGVERRLLGERRRPLTALSALRHSLLAQPITARPETEVARVIARAVRSPRAEVVLYGGGTVALDRRGATPLDVVLPLLHRHERIGELRIEPRSPGERFGRRDQELLAHLADEAAALLYGVRREAELAAARTEAITSAAQERARIGQDLHDGLGPLLAGAGLAAEALRRSLPAGSVDQRDAARLAEHLRQTAGEIRRLAHDLQPVALSESGLAVALAGHLESLRGDRQPTITVTVDAAELPPAVSQVAYLLVLEAVSNVIRHAHADCADVSVLARGGEVTVEVTDDGVGLGSSFRSGLGITSMRRRVEALGGSFSLTDLETGGTLMRAHIPRDV